FEPVEERHSALRGNYVARNSIPSAEIGVSCRDHAADQASVAGVIEKADNRLRHRSLFSPPAIGRCDKHERSFDLRLVLSHIHRQANSFDPKLFDEAMGVFRPAGEIDETAHGLGHARALIMSGRKPAQCCSPAMTTGT